MARKSLTVLLGDDPLWYKDAIIYEMHVRAFFDSDGDGIGDFRGITAKLDYLQDLGITAIWLLPFYPSPLKDDGYDIADYTDIHPYYGTLRDFRTFLREAKYRGLRVITELVVNHTSDQHLWFKRARRAAPGSRYRNYYVWSDTPDKYPEARIIFQDFESSNWAWDPVARAYYWHRFYSHQPDLNFASPDVRRAIFRAMDFWLSMGVDGLRLDAVPYLFERDGTNCENLPETHAFLKELRQHLDSKYSNRMLLAEANQWPEDAAAYFGRGDEAHMAFHFPLMPRMFMALRMEDRFPIVDILQQTPQIPDNCQWALFLRNHDELTLEMVTDEERDYMYRVYSKDPQARLNLGIRRRLAPLLGNNRRRIELMNFAALHPAGNPGALLRRRNRHGGQHLPGGPGRGADTHAVEFGPQRRVFPGQHPETLPAGHHRPGVPLRSHQRRGPAEQPHLAPVGHEAAHRLEEALQGLEPGEHRVFVPREQQGPGLCASVPGRAPPGHHQPLPVRAVCGAGPDGIPGDDPQRAGFPQPLPRDRRSSLLHHPGAPRGVHFFTRGTPDRGDGGAVGGADPHGHPPRAGGGAV